MKVFISWSGPISHEIAVALRDWLPSAIPALVPWVSSHDIAKGKRWSPEIAKELKESDYGIICVVPDNQNEPWLNFEAGALSKSFDFSRVYPFLLGLSAGQLDGPLSQFQVTTYDQSEVLQMLHSLNTAGESELSPPATLEKNFKNLWPALKKTLDPLKPKFGSSPTPNDNAKHSNVQSGEPDAVEIEILKVLADARDESVHLESLASYLQMKVAKTEYHMERLDEMGLVAHVHIVGGGTRYSLKKAGRRFLVNKGLL